MIVVSLSKVLMLLAAICLFWAALPIKQPPKVSLLALGLAFWALVVLMGVW